MGYFRIHKPFLAELRPSFLYLLLKIRSTDSGVSGLTPDPREKTSSSSFGLQGHMASLASRVMMHPISVEFQFVDHGITIFLRLLKYTPAFFNVLAELLKGLLLRGHRCDIFLPQLGLLCGLPQGF